MDTVDSPDAKQSEHQIILAMVALWICIGASD